MEMSNLNAVLAKKLESGPYSEGNPNNFTTEQELTVTITLHEYRELIAEQATKKHDINAARNDWYKARDELKKANETIANLKEKIVKLTMPEVPTNE